MVKTDARRAKQPLYIHHRRDPCPPILHSLCVRYESDWGTMAIESDQLQIQTMPLEIRVGMVAGPSAPLQDMFRVS